MELKKLQAEIEHILRNYPATRDSDEVLYANYLARHRVTTVSVAQFLNHFKDYGVSDFESVTRTRRKIVTKHPELAPAKKIQELREGRQESFIEFSRE